MDTVAADIDTTTASARAGFWRRWLATLIDWIVVALPFQVLAAILFALTAGNVQMDNAFFSFCEPASIPQGLDPPPPHDSNFARVCRFSLFGATTGATLTVGRTTREAAKTTTVTQGYMLDENGKPIRGTSIDGIVTLAFIGYLIAMIWKTGRTVGDRIIKVRVVDAARPSTPGVPLGRAIIRYLAMGIGVVPAFALLLHQYVIGSGSADAMFTADFFQWFIFTAALGALWAVVLIVQIARKNDPVYDRLAGTAVLRD